MGWAGLGNGELLAKGETIFQALITADANLGYQQHLAG